MNELKMGMKGKRKGNLIVLAGYNPFMILGAVLNSTFFFFFLFLCQRLFWALFFAVEKFEGRCNCILLSFLHEIGLDP